MKGTPVTIGLVVVAVVFAILAVLYGIGVLSVFTSTGAGGPHYKHAVVLAVLAVLCLIGANFTRQRGAA
jgi:hypothetical protein